MDRGQHGPGHVVLFPRILVHRDQLLRHVNGSIGNRPRLWDGDIRRDETSGGREQSESTDTDGCREKEHTDEEHPGDQNEGGSKETRCTFHCDPSFVTRSKNPMDWRCPLASLACGVVLTHQEPSALWWTGYTRTSTHVCGSWGGRKELAMS